MTVVDVEIILLATAVSGLLDATTAVANAAPAFAGAVATMRRETEVPAAILPKGQTTVMKFPGTTGLLATQLSVRLGEVAPSGRVSANCTKLVAVGPILLTVAV
jgi:hypothetical protein